MWRYVFTNSRWTKIPYQPSGDPASSTNDLTWSRFDETAATYKKGGYDGIGFVVSSGDPFVMIDLDHCVDPSTGEIADWANEILGKAKAEGAYCEKSPSSTGLHIIGRGKKNISGIKKNDAELYTSGRYFTITGALA